MADEEVDRARVEVSINYVTTVPRDPDAYEGAVELEDRLAKERQYIEEDGDYLFQALSVIPNSLVARVRPLHERHEEGDTLVGQSMQVIWEADFSAFVSKLYGRPYRLQQQGDMMGQNTYENFDVPDIETDEWEGQPIPTFAEWSTADATEPPKRKDDGSYNFDHMEWELRWERDYYPQFRAVIADLYRRGLMAPGRYSIHVWW